MKRLLGTDLNARSEKLTLSVVSLVFVVVMFLMSAYTSPLYPHYYGGDSAIFSLIAKGMTSGKVVYLDLFDHKGPILFFIEYLGYYLAGHTGILILQCTFGLFTLHFLYASWKKLCTYSKLVHLIIIGIYTYTYFFFTFEKGNLSEEYSLPFIAVCQYLFIKYALCTSKTKRHPYRYAVIYGICLTTILLIRVNNSITICAGVFVIFVYLILNKEYKNLLINIFAGLIGCFLVFIPVLFYFYSKSALEEMLYATFTYNFKYAASIAHSFSLNWKTITLYAPVIISILLFLCYFFKKKNNPFTLLDALLGTIIFLNALTLCVANKYPHYFTIFVPVYFAVLSRYYSINTKKTINTVLIVSLSLNLSYNAMSLESSLYSCWFTNDVETKHQLIVDGVEPIPENEKDSVIGYNIPASTYLNADIMPCYKYYTFQEWWSISDPDIYTEFYSWLNEEKPTWLLVLPDEDSEDLKKIIATNYYLISSNSSINTYKLIEH